MSDLTSTLEIGEEIGHGHFGRVHIGHDGVRDLLAIKVLRQAPDETDEKWQSRRSGLLKEGANLEKAKHRNIVPVHYVCQAKDADAIYLVMEFCSGGSLENQYKNGPLSQDYVGKIARDVCSGLAVLHDRNMIHRDIKPGNILLDDKGTAKISDFGFVTDDIIEGYAAGGGYRDHLAPEYYTDRISSVRTDLWALGVTLYRLLHGHDWYSAGPAPRYIVPEGGYANSLDWLPHINKGWRRLIRSLLADDPSDRPSNARAVLRVLAGLEASDWQCALGDGGISWNRTKANRRIVVSLKKHSSRRFSWEAISFPTNEGQKKRLCSSEGIIGYRQAERELRNFFD